VRSDHCSKFHLLSDFVEGDILRMYHNNTSLGDLTSSAGTSGETLKQLFYTVIGTIKKDLSGYFKYMETKMKVKQSPNIVW
jgi:hypothetical protein